MELYEAMRTTQLTKLKRKPVSDILFVDSWAGE